MTVLGGASVIFSLFHRDQRDTHTQYQHMHIIPSHDITAWSMCTASLYPCVHLSPSILCVIKILICSLLALLCWNWETLIKCNLRASVLLIGRGDWVLVVYWGQSF